jgi:GAF domain-containing protein
VSDGAQPRALDDPERMRALVRADLLDSPIERPFERLTALASRLLHAPVSLISIVEGRRQFLKSAAGLGEPAASERGTPLSHSFCQHVVTSAEPLVVADARLHPLVRDNPAVVELGIVAYAGMPLLSSDGYVLGTLCAIDHVPRTWTEGELDTLRDLAESVVSEIELRMYVREREERAMELNDDVVQDLTAAKLALHADRPEEVARAIDSALGSAKTIISELVRGRAPSALRRRTASGG